MRKKATISLWLISTCFIQSLLFGAAYYFQNDLIKISRICLAVVIPPLAWLSFREWCLSSSINSKDFFHFIPLIIMIVIIAYAPLAIDSFLSAIYFFYAYKIFVMLKQAPDIFEQSSFSNISYAIYGGWLLFVILLLSAITDLIIHYSIVKSPSLDINWILSISNVLNLLLLILAIVLIMYSTPNNVTNLKDGSAKTTASIHSLSKDSLVIDDEADRNLYEQAKNYLEESKLYCELNLNLSLLSRRLNTPAKEISRVINSQGNMNVSQFINSFRIKEACRLLDEGEENITRVMDGCGFQTKSNFNREFKRMTKQTPTQYKNNVSN